jgi:hypothetical protein
MAKTWKLLFGVVVGGLIAALVTACGGGSVGGGSSGASGPSTISGTASSGATILGTVTITDSSTPVVKKTVDVGANGSYTVDVSGMTAPYLLRADGVVGDRAISVHSVALAGDVGGTLNVTPLTELIVSNAAKKAAANADADGSYKTLTATALSAAESSVHAQLQPLLDVAAVANTVDLLHTPITTNNTGVDAVMDAVQVTLNTSTNKATITNAVNGSAIANDFAGTNTAKVDASNTATALTDFQKIVQQFNAWSALFGTSVPAANDPALLALFDQTPGGFLWDGQDLNGFLTDVTTLVDSVSGVKIFQGAKFSNVTLNSVDVPAAPTVARVSFAISYAQGRFDTYQAVMHKVGTAWFIAGNQKIGMAQVKTYVRTGDGVTTDTGLAFEINSPNSNFQYAVVTGPGLPETGAGVDGSSAGLLYFAVPDDSFTVASLGAAYRGAATIFLPSAHNQYAMNDTLIGALSDNAVYTITLFTDNATPTNLADDAVVATYSVTPGKRPYLNSELAALTFPQITTPNTAIKALADNGGNLTVSWTLPNGLRSHSVNFFRNNGTLESAEGDVLTTSTSAVVKVAAPATVGGASGINLFVHDVFNRELAVTKDGG